VSSCHTCWHQIFLSPIPTIALPRSRSPPAPAAIHLRVSAAASARTRSHHAEQRAHAARGARMHRTPASALAALAGAGGRAERDGTGARAPRPSAHGPASTSGRSGSAALCAQASSCAATSAPKKSAEAISVRIEPLKSFKGFNTLRGSIRTRSWNKGDSFGLCAVLQGRSGK